MNITVEKMTELPDGGAICTLELDKESAQFLIGEGFLAVIKRSLDTSESYVSEQKLSESLMAQDIEDALNNLRVACGYAPKYKILKDGVVYFYTDEE
jgi:hypothetical protein